MVLERAASYDTLEVMTGLGKDESGRLTVALKLSMLKASREISRLMNLCSDILLPKKSCEVSGLVVLVGKEKSIGGLVEAFKASLRIAHV